MGAVCRRGLTRGLVSRPFHARALERAAAARADSRTVFVDVDAGGYLCAAGAGAGAGGGEAVAARARLAPHEHAAHLVLAPAGEGAGAGGGELRLRCERAAAPLHDVLLWFDDELRARIQLPALTLHNIRGDEEYECGECGVRFAEPNPLKTHLFLRCAPLTPQRFWHAVAERLEGGAPRDSPPPAPGLTSAFRRVEPAGRAALEAAEEAAAAWAARLEAAAAEWGRARGGHACLYCGKLYSRKYGLKIHLRTHTGYRPLRCRHCARAFGDPSNLNKHVRLHAAAAGGARAHACPRCGKPLARRRDLERHLRAHCTRAGPAPPARTVM